MDARFAGKTVNDKGPSTESQGISDRTLREEDKTGQEV